MIDLLIIGAGPVGLYTAFYACLNNLNVVVVEIDTIVGGAPKKMYPEKYIYDIPCILETTGSKIIEQLLEQLATQKNWKIEKGVVIQEIKKKEEYYQVFSNKQIFECKNIIFATGYGAFKYNKIDDHLINDKQTYKKIHYEINDLNIYKNKKIIICGGGNSAIDYGLLLEPLVKNIKLIHHNNKLKALSTNVEKLKSKKKVNFLLDANIESIGINKIEVLINEKKQIFDYDYLLVFYGTTTIESPLANLGIFNEMHKINVDENMQSLRFKNIYAIGACNDKGYHNLMVNGFSQGTIVIDYIVNNKK